MLEGPVIGTTSSPARCLRRRSMAACSRSSSSASIVSTRSKRTAVLSMSVPLNKTKSVGYYQRFVTAFPDIHFEVLHVLAEGDHVLIHWRGSGTHTERLATVTGETIPPSRRRMRVSGALLTEVRDGKVVRLWGYFDQLSVLAQLGITQQPGLFLSPEGF